MKKKELDWLEAKMLRAIVRTIWNDLDLSKGFRRVCCIYAKDLRHLDDKLSQIVKRGMEGTELK